MAEVVVQSGAVVSIPTTVAQVTVPDSGGAVVTSAASEVAVATSGAPSVTTGIQGEPGPAATFDEINGGTL